HVGTGAADRFAQPPGDAGWLHVSAGSLHRQGVFELSFVDVVVRLEWPGQARQFVTGYQAQAVGPNEVETNARLIVEVEDGSLTLPPLAPEFQGPSQLTWAGVQGEAAVAIESGRLQVGGTTTMVDSQWDVFEGTLRDQPQPPTPASMRGQRVVLQGHGRWDGLATAKAVMSPAPYLPSVMAL